MINLMPDNYKESLHYARRNTTLLNWLFGMLVILSIASATIIIGKSYLHAQTKHYASLNQQAQDGLKANNLEGTIKTVQDISGNLKLIIQVLSKEVVFSDLLKHIGAVMPSSSVLSDIEISKVAGGIDLSANARDYKTATQVQINLADPNNKLFDKVDIVSVTCNNDSPTYPCTVKLRALFSKDNPFLFINQSQKGSTQ